MRIIVVFFVTIFAWIKNLFTKLPTVPIVLKRQKVVKAKTKRGKFYHMRMKHFGSFRPIKAFRVNHKSI